MRKILLLLLVVLFCKAEQTTAQETVQDKKPVPKLIKRYEKRLVSSYRLEEDAIDLASGAREPKGRIAFRFCSAKPLKDIYRRGTLSSFLMSLHLKTAYEVLENKILYLRSADCVNPKVANTKRTIVETWVIPNGADLPPNDEAATLSEKGGFQTLEADKVKKCQ